MSKFLLKTEHLPSITDIEMDANQLRSMLNPLGLRELHLWDSRYFYCSHEDWGKVLVKVLLGMPKYVAEKLDCENMAMIASARTSELFKLNTLGIAIGQSPWGYHGFNLFVSRVDDENKLYYLEPQTSMVYDVTENSGYRAEIVILA